MPRKPLKPRNKKAQIEDWQIECLKTGFHEWWSPEDRREKIRRCAFVSLSQKQEKIWRTIRDQVNWSDFPYAVKNFEGVQNAKETA